MLLIKFNLLAAIDFNTIWLIGILVVGFISWLSNMVKKNQPPQPPARKPRQGGGQLSKEIDIFLQEVTGRKRDPEPVELELVPEEEIQQRRRVRRRKPLQPTSTRAKPAPPVKKKRVRPGSRIAQRHEIGSRNLGSGVKSHLAEHMEAGRIEKEVEQHLDHDVDRSVTEHLGLFGRQEDLESQAVIKPPTAATEIVAMLRDPKGIRQAILISEVLGRPGGRNKR